MSLGTFPNIVMSFSCTEQVVATQTGDMPMTVTVETLDAAYDFVNAVVGMDLTVRPLNQPETKLRLVQNFTAVSRKSCINLTLSWT